MGIEMTFEIGRLNIGRRVRVFRMESSKQHATVGTLTGATPRYGVVRLDHHKSTENIEWENIIDWVSGNPKTPLVLPEPPAPLPPKAVSVPLANVDTPGNPVPAALRNGDAPKATPIPPPNPALLGDLGQRIEQAVRDVRETKAMYEDAKQKLGALRAEMGRMTSAMNDLLSEGVN